MTVFFAFERAEKFTEIGHTVLLRQVEQQARSTAVRKCSNVAQGRSGFSRGVRFDQCFEQRLAPVFDIQRFDLVGTKQMSPLVAHFEAVLCDGLNDRVLLTRCTASGSSHQDCLEYLSSRARVPVPACRMWPFCAGTPRWVFLRWSNADNPERRD